MEKDLITKNFADAKVKVKLDEGTLILEASYPLAQIVGKVVGPAVDGLKKLIPGETAWENAAAEFLKKAIDEALGISKEEPALEQAKEELCEQIAEEDKKEKAAE